VTTGASNDIQRATEIARNMVTKWGMSERLGPLMYGEENGEVFLGYSVTQHKVVSDGTAHVIDQEVRSLIDRNYSRSEQILKDNMTALHLMAESLIKYETLESEQIDDVMAGNEPRPPKGWNDNDSNRNTPRSNDDGKVVELKPKEGGIGGTAQLH